MRKPAGVIAAAVVMGLMAALGTLGVSLSLVLFLFMHNPVNIPGFRVIVVSSNLFVLAFFLFAGWTVAGLFRMRSWARVAAIVIGALVCLFSGVACIGTLAVRHLVPAMPPPPPGEPATMLARLPLIFVGVAMFYFAIALVGLWWAIYFSLPKVRAAFAGGGLFVTNPEIVPPGGAVTLAPALANGTSGWRIVIVVWACLMLLGILGLPVVSLMHIPMFLFGRVLSGGAEIAVVLPMFAVQVLLGVGLIQKWKFAWYLGIAWQIYAFAYGLSFAVPGMWGRFIAYQVDMSRRWALPGTAEMTSAIWHGPFMAVCFGLGLVLIVVFTVALFKRKEDYLDA